MVFICTAHTAVGELVEDELRVPPPGRVGAR